MVRKPTGAIGSVLKKQELLPVALPGWLAQALQIRNTQQKNWIKITGQGKILGCPARINQMAVRTRWVRVPCVSLPDPGAGS